MWHTVFGKLQIVDPSEGRGVNFHTLAKKTKQSWCLIYNAPPPSGMHGGVCVRMCDRLWTVFCICGYDHQSVLETVSSYLS